MTYRLLYDIAGAAEMLSTSERRIKQLRASGQLPAVHDGDDCRFRHEDLRSYADSLPAWKNFPHPTPELEQRAEIPHVTERVTDSVTSPDPKRIWLTRVEVAERLQISRSTLESWAVEGKGPRFRRFGGRVRYRLAEVEEWEATAQ